jgi:hypothetical protein
MCFEERSIILESCIALLRWTAGAAVPAGAFFIQTLICQPFRALSPKVLKSSAKIAVLLLCWVFCGLIDFGRSVIIQS